MARIDFSSGFFTPHTDEDSGAVSHILTKKVAPVQQGFYFVNDGMSADGRYLWFYCAFPPSGSGGAGRTLGVVDFEKLRMSHFPETQFQAASPYVDPDTGAVYFTSGDTIWRRGPEPGDAVEPVNSIPEEVTGHRGIGKLATHLTRSADGREFFIDASIGLQFVFGSLPLDGGDFEFWHRFDRNYNHAQFSPTDPDLALFSEEFHFDKLTGLCFPITDRMWLIRRGEDPRPVFKTPTRVTHEWWDADGEHIWHVWGDTLRVNMRTLEVERMNWDGGTWHSHASRDGRLLVGDRNEQKIRGCASEAHFLNRETGVSIRLAANPEMFDYTGRNYHIDPHPRFCLSDAYVVFTTTVRGEVDLAIASTADLLEITS